MGFDTAEILRRYRGEWISGNVAEPYMAGETVRDLGSIYYSNIDNNSGNIRPEQDSNWTLSARTAEVGMSLETLIGNAESPTVYGSVLTGRSGTGVVVPPSEAGSNLGLNAGEISYTAGGEAPQLREVFTHFSSHVFHLSLTNRFTAPDYKTATLAITSNDKICVITHFGFVYRVFDKDIVPRGEINGVRQAAWGDWGYYYVIDVNNILYAQNKDTGELLMITDNVQHISVATESPDSKVVICKFDGTVWGWGANTNSYLVPNETTNTGFLSTPVQITGLSDIAEVHTFCGGLTFYACDTTRELYSWGENSNGMAGRTPTNDTSAVPPLVIASNFDKFFSWRRLITTVAPEPITDIEGLVVIATLNNGLGGLTTWGSETLAVPHAYLGEGSVRTNENWEPTEVATDASGAYKTIYFRDDGDTAFLTLFAITGDGVIYSWGITTEQLSLRGAGTLPLQLAYTICDLSYLTPLGYTPDIRANSGFDYLAIEGRFGIRLILVFGSSNIVISGTSQTTNIGIRSEFIDARGYFILGSDGNIFRLSLNDVQVIQLV